MDYKKCNNKNARGNILVGGLVGVWNPYHFHTPGDNSLSTSIWDFKEHVSPEYLQQCENLWDRYRKNYGNNPFWMMRVKKIGGL